MRIHLLNFPREAERDAVQILTERGHTPTVLPYDDLFVRMEQESPLSLVLVYDHIVNEESTSLYRQLLTRHPESVAWMVCPSYRPEDVRMAMRAGYANYVLWSPDLEDFRNAIDELDHKSGPPRYYIQNKVDVFHVVNYPLDQQLTADRLLTSLTAQGGSLASSYIPLLYRMEELRNCWYTICVIQKQLPLNLYFRQDYESVLGITATQLRLHMETLENDLAPSFGILKYVENDTVICLFYHKEPHYTAEMLRFLQRLTNRVQQYQGISLLIGYSQPYERLEDTHLHFGRIHRNLSQGHFEAQPCIHMLDEERTYASFSKEVDDYIKKNLFLSISNNDFDLMSKTLIGAVEQFMEQNVMSSFAKTVLLQTLIRFAQETNFYLLVSHEFVEHTLAQAVQRIPLFPALQEVFRMLQSIYAEARRVYSDDDSNRLALAMQYINKNYYRKITLQSISDHLALTPNYFCGWFKKKTGENFADTVIRYRIDAAKSMLAHSDKKICDVANEVGYSEIVSFNRVFKKVVGMTPTQFRSRHGDTASQ